uniref:hypothetical protein n=1 Tax=Nonomuraea pusilla TaxID=46177 RepID=UPI0006E16067|nr:hypothetical protein [Nonomuraea pusilla]
MITEQPRRPPAAAPRNDGRAAGEPAGAVYPGDVHWYDLPDDETELDAETELDSDSDSDSDAGVGAEPGELPDGGLPGLARSRR